MSEPAISRYSVDPRVSPLSRRMGFLVAALAIIALPLIFNDTYWRTNLTLCAINVLLALGLDFILGYTGQLNLGHSAFYGLGAYVSTLLIVKLGVPFWGAFVAGVAFSGLAGMFLSLFAVRLRGHYLAIASLISVNRSSSIWATYTAAFHAAKAVEVPIEPVTSFGSASIS